MRQTSLWIVGLGAVAVSAAVVASASATARAAAQNAAAVTNSPLGDTLPAVVLTDPQGMAVSLRARIANRPALLYVFGVAECASCSQLALEFTIARRELASLEPLLIASGAGSDALLPYIRHMGVESAALIDERRQLLSHLALDREPVVLLVDATGRIVFVDHRSAPKAAQYPMGRILRDLRAMFAVVAESTAS